MFELLTPLAVALATCHRIPIGVKSDRCIVVQADHTVEILRGIIDKQIRIFAGNVSVGTFTPEGMMEEAFKLASNSYSQAHFKADVGRTTE